MLLDIESSCLLIVDVQEKLIPKIMDHEQLVANCKWLIEVAKKLKVPVLVSEQYPKGLGSTVASLKDLITTPCLEKVHFSCVGDRECYKAIDQLNRPQIVVAGIETHVCVMQTAMQLEGHGKQVYVVADAVSSRRELDKESALERMRVAGIQIITKEMVLFEWLRQAGTLLFKEMSQEFLKND